MCEFCTQHGEGKKWYLQAKNYSQELLNEQRRQYMAEFFSDFEHMMGDKAALLDTALGTDPAGARSLFPSIVEQQKKDHWGQVVPIEEIEQILDMSLSVVRVPCVCRGMLRGFREARYCFGVTGTPPQVVSKALTISELPDYKDLEVLNTTEAKKAIRKLDKEGLVHSVWTFISPMIGGICNCSVNDCLALKTRTRLGLQTMFKAEYVAEVDWETCNGCRNCMRVCNFGAISYSPHSRKVSINQLQCYGCGVCRALCAKNSIKLVERAAVPALAGEW
jgi:Pyruvate/2-oxoacid:ferredoxin oxidoreductase delta subunit